ncbi:MAG TPA: MarR family transcriptional regulator [Alphaproteobacteria bacterium]|nr:MarR family transcriptional regulator [Alphaproteobacteria bacterium]
MHDFPLGRLIAVVARLWRNELDNRLQPHGLSQARYVLLVHLAEADGPIAQNDLAERAGIRGPTLVRHLDQLEASGLVQRQDFRDDRRVKHVLLTVAGRERCAEAGEVAMKLREELVAPFTPDQTMQTEKTLQGLVEQLETIRAGAGQ